MQTQTFVDYYELLECSPNARLETIEQLFRHLAKEFHPVAGERGDAKKFGEIVQIFQTLQDPQKRAEYDREYRRQKEACVETREAIVPGESSSMKDTDERFRILTVLYNRRRNNMKHPGQSPSSLAEMTGCADTVIDFHIWYFMQKGWVMREESGVVSITALGVDRIDEMNLALTQKNR